MADIGYEDRSDWQYVRFVGTDQLYLVPIPEASGLHRLVVKVSQVSYLFFGIMLSLFYFVKFTSLGEHLKMLFLFFRISKI